MTAELIAYCLSQGIAFPANRREQRALELVMREAEPFEYRPAVESKPDWHSRADFDCDCNGMQLKAGS